MRILIKNSFRIILPLLAVIVFSCRKDKPIPDPLVEEPTDTVQEPPPSQVLSINDISLEDTACHNYVNVPLTHIVHNADIQYKMPCFNPNNTNEFIYYYKNSQNSTYQLIKYNMQTEQKTIIMNSFSSVTKPKWGVNDKIVYNPNYNINTMNTDGTGITQISGATANLYPSGNDDYVYWLHSEVLGVPYYFLRYHILTTDVDTLLFPDEENQGYAGYSDISLDDKLICRTIINEKISIAYTKLNDINFQGLVNIEINYMASLADICWAPNGEDFYFTVLNEQGSGLFKMNINNPNTATKLVKHCPTKQYHNISVSPDGNYIVGERMDSRYDSTDNKIKRDFFIYKLNLNTLEETKIDLE